MATKKDFKKSEKALQEVVLLGRIEDALKKLSPRERRIIEQSGAKTPKQLAEALGLSKKRI